MKPIYVVLYRQIFGDAEAQRYGIRQLVRVIACDLSEWDAIYVRDVAPLQNIPPYIGWEMFTREPENALRDMATAEEGAAQ